MMEVRYSPIREIVVRYFCIDNFCVDSSGQLTKFWGGKFADSEIVRNFALGKSYTTSSPPTPPGLDRSNGNGL